MPRKARTSHCFSSQSRAPHLCILTQGPAVRNWTKDVDKVQVPMLSLRMGLLRLTVGVSVALLSVPASAAEYVDLKLVLATDVSGSINNDELWLERRGTAAAFLYPDVIRAIEGGAIGRIAVAMVDFSSPGFGKTVID